MEFLNCEAPRGYKNKNMIHNDKNNGKLYINEEVS